MNDDAKTPSSTTVTDVLGLGTAIAAICWLIGNVAMYTALSMPLWIWFVAC